MANHLNYEIERGKPIPTKNQSIVQTRLVFELMLHCRKKYDILSKATFLLDLWRIVPDISIRFKTEFNFKKDKLVLEKAPIGVIEILSPTQNFQELIEKVQEYFEHGVKSCWLVMPSVRNIYVFSDADIYQIFRHTEVLRDEILEIDISLEEIFAKKNAFKSVDLNPFFFEKLKKNPRNLCKICVICVPKNYGIAKIIPGIAQSNAIKITPKIITAR
jgi:Uma2 family endonuclease